MAQLRPRLVGFAAEMLGGLARKDQRAAGELYVRGLLTLGSVSRCSRWRRGWGVDHQRLQQFITSSTWITRRCGGTWRGISRPSAGGGAGDR